ncbi:MAG TPA: MaoC family dehydratase [Ferrovibrio sp.]|jgi:acyl dehydratase|uniref:MaoC family dehydratase n=1 Tax=Ferrovibrio sp. TaxID=1917215 RepID=UPI002B4AF34A|nr:MaoC family dehydratase [Ferrovibrio sp.]HLT76063.1 MaoC family dehydratase [Ferrovibrio sp.]
MQYFEDIIVGASRDTGSHTFTQDAIIAFAKQFDPQPFHIDPEAAKDSNFGGIIASGWHTAATVMRLLVDSAIDLEASLGSPGFDDLSWLKPVRPGDTIRARLTCIEKTPSKSRPGIGSARFLVEVFNQKDELVMKFISIGLMRFRNKPA